jgi:hypothetical protein
VGGPRAIVHRVEAAENVNFALEPFCAADGRQRIPRRRLQPGRHQLAAVGGDNRLYIWTLQDDRAERFAVVNTLLARSAEEDGERRREGALWLDWGTNDRIALATSSSAITVIGLDPTRWQQRVDGLAIAPPAPLN